MKGIVLIVITITIGACATDPTPPKDPRFVVARDYCEMLSVCRPGALVFYGADVDASIAQCTNTVGEQLTVPLPHTGATNEQCAADLEAQEGSCVGNGMSIPDSCGWFGFLHSCDAVCHDDTWIPTGLGGAGSSGYLYSTCSSTGVHCANPGQ